MDVCKIRIGAYAIPRFSEDIILGFDGLETLRMIVDFRTHRRWYLDRKSPAETYDFRVDLVGAALCCGLRVLDAQQEKEMEALLDKLIDLADGDFGLTNLAVHTMNVGDIPPVNKNPGR